MTEDGLSVRLQEPLARHTALRTGGRCDVWVVAHHDGAVACVVGECRTARWRLSVLGAGTRTVVRDGPIAGAVLRLGVGFTRIEDHGETWQVGAATPVPALVAAAVRAGRTGIEGHAATPGTLGASLMLDAGWSEVVESVEILRRGIATRVDYDDVVGRKNVIVLRVHLRLVAAEGVAERAFAALAGSAAVPSGSWYSPRGDEPVRDVFRSVRLHMVRLRQIVIPEAAPELLVNLGNGTAADLSLLAKSAFERVKKVRGDQIEPRMRWMGSASA